MYYVLASSLLFLLGSFQKLGRESVEPEVEVLKCQIGWRDRIEGLYNRC